MMVGRALTDSLAASIDRLSAGRFGLNRHCHSACVAGPADGVGGDTLQNPVVPHLMRAGLLRETYTGRCGSTNPGRRA